MSVKNKSLVKGSILLPDKVNGQEVKSIKEGAFSGCTELTDISIPSLVTSIGEDAFSGCTSLKSIYIDSIEGATDAPTGAPWGATDSPTIYWTGNYIGYNSMETGDLALTVDNKSLVTGSIVLPDKVNGKEVVSIASYAFDGCSNMTSISIQATVTSIGYNTFRNCTGLREITIPKEINYIANLAFIGCKNLSVKIEKISLDRGSWPSAFDEGWNDGCGPIYVTVCEGVSSIAGNAFNSWASLKSISIPSTVSEIGEGIFNGCHNLESIYIDKERESIIFESGSCNSNPSVIWASDYTVSVPDGYISAANKDAENLTLSGTIVIPDKVTSYADDSSDGIVHEVKGIAKEGFANQTNLTSVVIPATIEYIGESAFNGCSELTTIKYLASESDWKTLVEKSSTNWKGGLDITTVVCIGADGEEVTVDL